MTYPLCVTHVMRHTRLLKSLHITHYVSNPVMHCSQPAYQRLNHPYILLLTDAGHLKFDDENLQEPVLKTILG